MIVEDYGGAGTSTYPRMEEPCADSNETCLGHIQEELIDYIMKMLEDEVVDERHI